MWLWEAACDSGPAASPSSRLRCLGYAFPAQKSQVWGKKDLKLSDPHILIPGPKHWGKAPVGVLPWPSKDTAETKSEGSVPLV